jgi:hypothetical protein
MKSRLIMIFGLIIFTGVVISIGNWLKRNSEAQIMKIISAGTVASQRLQATNPKLEQDHSQKSEIEVTFQPSVIKGNPFTPNGNITVKHRKGGVKGIDDQITIFYPEPNDSEFQYSALTFRKYLNGLTEGIVERIGNTPGIKHVECVYPSPNRSIEELFTAARTLHACIENEGQSCNRPELEKTVVLKAGLQFYGWRGWVPAGCQEAF